MVNYDPTNLGRAVASLGLDSEFLSKGGLESFSVPEKSQLVNGIVDKNLKGGKWLAVVDMIYKDSSNIGVLYGGDRSELEDRILESAQRCPESFIGETIGTLKNKGEQELLFRLATEAPFDYKTLQSLSNSIRDYLSDHEQGEQRIKKLNSVLGNAAFKCKEFGDALRYFERVENTEGIGKIFEELVFGEEYGHYREDIGERAALADPTQKESRLKRLVLGAIRKRNISPWKAFQIFKKYDVPISLLERSILYNRAAEKISTHEIEEANDLELSLLWAKKHTDTHPKEAYSILNKEEPNGEDVLKAASSGIKYDSDFQRREYYGLSLDKISKAHLKKLLSKAPFDIRVKIARHFEDGKALKSLSRKALKGKNLYEAYNLWVEGKGNPKDPDMSKVRTKLITKRISGSEYRFLNFKEDPVGAAEYYDALMNAGDFKEAHEVALDLGDEERAQRTREKILKGDLEKALSFFMSCGIKDEKGIKHVMEKTAETHNVPIELVKEMIEKHHPYIEK
jgi:hypothetical protein